MKWQYLLSFGAGAVAETSWWTLPGTDCDSCDVTTQQPLPSEDECPKASSSSCKERMSEACVAKFRAACEATPGCGGFNTNRVFKNSKCGAAATPLPQALACVDLHLIAGGPLPPAPTYAPVWPLPASMSYGSSSVSLPKDGSFAFVKASDPTCAGGASQVLSAALERFTALLTPDPGQMPGGAILTGVDVCVASRDETLSPLTNESYSLTVPADGGMGMIQASTVYGAMRAMESFAQVVGIGNGTAFSNGLIQIAPLEIVDEPRFSYRGLMIDTGRHFLPVSFVKHIIDAMAQNKLNVLHWHLVDAESFPSGSDLYPQLAEKGAYSDVARYSTADLREVVAFARERGVRVVPEWDMPGHGSWWHAFPELMASPTSIVMDPTNEQLYVFLRRFLGEMVSIFPDAYLFLGGDEVDPAVWDANPNISAWLTSHNMTSGDLQQYFWRRMKADVLPTLNRTLAVWENNALQIDPAELPEDAVVNVYQALETATTTLKRGLKTTVSMAQNHWYLDMQTCGGYYQNAWKCVYNVDPGTAAAGLPEEQARLLLGGETAMWGEGVNQDNFDAFVWRNTAAAAERLWSPLSQTQQAVDITMKRLATHACKMTKRGVAVGAVDRGYCPTDALEKVEHDSQSELEALRAENARLREQLSRSLFV